MRAGIRRFPLLGFICSFAMACHTASPGRPPPLIRESLVGAWTLTGIEYEGPQGPLLDPFYQAGSTGILIYEPGGLMSVHISAPHRTAWEPAAARLPPSSSDPDVKRKAEAFDSYYAYYGTWTFDARTSVVTHHVESSLVPGEVGVDYTQSVTLQDGRLIFTNRSTDQGEPRVRRKVWERLSAAGSRR